MADERKAAAGDSDEVDETPWSDEIDPFVRDIDSGVSSKYGISFVTLLTNPSEYANKANISMTVNGVKDFVDSYFSDLMEDLGPEQEQLTKEMESIDALYTKLDQTISSKAAVARVPYLKPVNVDLGDTSPETISIDQYNNNVDTLIGKFVNVSNYIANMSTTYKKYSIGAWLFSGERSYMLSVSQPDSTVITVENAKQYIEDAIGSAMDALSSAPEK